MPSLLFCLCFLLPHLLSLPLFFSLLCHVILDLLQIKVYARAIKQNVLGYYRNLGTERVLRLVKTHMGKCLFSPELKSYLITQWNCTTIGSCRCRKTNQWVGSGAARTYGDDTRQIPAETGGVSGYISGRFAIGSSDFFSFSDDDFVYTDPEAYSPLTRLAVGPSDLDLLGWSAFNAPQQCSSSGPVRCHYPAIISRKSLKEQIGVLRSPLHADDDHSECVSCLGKSHADAALAGSDCSHCESISLTSLRTRIAFFSESDPAPRALPFSSSQGPVRKKQRGRGSQRPVESKLTPAQIPRASLSPHRDFTEISPGLRRLSSPQNLHLPFSPLSLLELSSREGVHAQPDATPLRSARAPDSR